MIILLSLRNEMNRDSAMRGSLKSLYLHLCHDVAFSAFMSLLQLQYNL